MFNLMKVFNGNSMPNDAREQFDNYYEDHLYDNAYIYHSVNSMYNHEKKLNLVDAWLLKEGANDQETILIHVYW